MLEGGKHPCEPPFTMGVSTAQGQANCEQIVEVGH